MTEFRVPWPMGAWRREMAEAVNDLDQLLECVGLTRASVGLDDAAADATREFAARVPRALVKRIRRGDSSDPILRQVLPSRHEVEVVEGYGTNPVGELGALADGVLRKYRGRALLIVSSACAVHCRYCFRRHFPYAGGTVEAPTFAKAVAQIEADASITEVILSGGDPLSLADRHLEDLCEALEAIDHVRRLRWHTRTPVVLPSRVDEGLLTVLEARCKPTIFVVHVNHPCEIDDDVRTALTALATVGVHLLNQSVLLAGVNDDADTLVDLSEALLSAGVLPYYLHCLDPVAGAAHFDVSEDRARALAAEISARLPGYLVPKLVREVEGAPGKVLLTPRLHRGAAEPPAGS